MRNSKLNVAKYLAAHPSPRVRQMVQSGGPRSFFYGDPEAVVVSPEDAGEELGKVIAPGEAAEAAIANAAPDTDTAAARLIQYGTMSPLERNAVTVIPAISTFNATVRMDPLLGKLSANSLNFNANKSNNEYPFEGLIKKFTPDSSVSSTARITLSLTANDVPYAIPFFSVTITNSTLNAQTGLPYAIDWIGTDEKGTTIKSSNDITGGDSRSSQNAQFVFYRTDATKIVNVICVPFRVVATRTCPFMPVVTGVGEGSRSFTVQIQNLEPGAVATLTIMGRATYEMKTIGKLFNLPACDLD